MRNLEGWTVAFDLDGTLIDTAPDLLATARATLTHFGYPAVPDVKLRPWISHGSRRILVEGCGAVGIELAEAELDRMFAFFLDHYRRHIADYSRPFPGVHEVVARLAGDGARCVVCTNKLEEPSCALLEALGMLSLFDVVAGRDTYPVHKPDPRHLLNAVRSAGGLGQRALMVGDSDVDVATAKAAGVPIIGVTFGYTHIPITDLGCNAVISGYDEFDEALVRIIGIGC